jgi:tetratricopeptide (TPR) repeat protein
VFQYAFDRCNENVQISKQICMDLIEEYASFDTPWRLLAFVLMRNKEYDDAVIAAKKAVSLALWNKDNVLVLYKIYHTNNKFNVAAEVRERYVAMALVERELLAQNDDEIHTEALERFTADLQVLDTLIQEDDLVVSMGAALKEHQFRYDLAHLYSKNADEVEDRIRRKVHEAEAEAERLRGDQVECVAAGQVPLADSGSA